MNHLHDFQVPFTFLNLTSSRDASFSPSTVLASWGLSRDDSNTSAGSVVGLEDGSVILLRRSEMQGKRNSPTKPSSPRLSPAALSRTSLSATASRSNSPSGSHISHISPFSVTQRSRVVSGITSEQVEAPKNYVDFDDEPEKLKDMLKGRGPRERTSLDSHREKDVKIPAPAESSPSGRKRKEPPRSMLSATASPALSPLSVSVPPSPKGPSHFQFSRDLEFVCHVIPPSLGQAHRVSGIELLHGNELSAVLQQSLAILSNQDGKLFTSVTIADTSLSSSGGVKHSQSMHDIWLWTHLRSYVVGESNLLLASATIAPESVSASLGDSDETSKDRCRVVLLELRTSHLIGTLEAALEPIGQWFCNGLPQTVGLHYTENQSLVFYSLTSDSKFAVQHLHILPKVHNVATPTKEPQESQLNLNLGALGPLPNLFKSKLKSPNDGMSLEPTFKLDRVRLDDVSIIGDTSPQASLLEYNCSPIGDSLKGVGWSGKELTAFDYANGRFTSLFSYPLCDVFRAQWLDHNTIAVILEDRCELYNAVSVDASGEEIAPSAAAGPVLIQPRLLKTISIASYDTIEFSTALQLLIVDCNHQITKYAWYEKTPRSPKDGVQTIWRRPRSPQKSSAEVTAMLALDLESIILGYSDGHLRQSSFLNLCDEQFSLDDCSSCSDFALDGKIVSLHLAKNERTNTKYLIGGGDDGSIAIWTTDLKLCARWIVFTTSLFQIAQFPDVKGDPLQGAILCVSEDGTIAVIALDGFQFLYVVPGSPFPLQRVCLGKDDLLLVYIDQRVRLWDVRTREFRRTLSMDKAEELFAQGGWSDIPLLSSKTPLNRSLNIVSARSRSLDVACTVSLDLNNFISDSLLVIKALSTNEKQTKNIFLAREHLRSALSFLLTPGLNRDIDDVCFERLGVKRANSSVGFVKDGFVSLYHYLQPEHCWSLSGDVSAAHALAIVAILRALSVFEELSENTSTVIAFYATGLAGPVGPAYKPPNLAFLARRWFESSSELRHSVRLLFDAAVIRLTDEETNAIVDEWQHQLPCLQPTADKESALAALSLFLCGYLAADKYSMLSTSALTDIAKSITMYLHEEDSVHRVLAIDLCSRGFHVWQHYIDALDILRSLFSLATNSKKESINAQNVSAQARLATLHIASTNTPLFMTTLGLDILNPTSTEQRKSVMQIVALLIKKARLRFLYSNLPKLMEAVVKSLDPNSTSNRDAVLDTATEILGHVVKTFPTVDFHMSSQRLAVGTSEGAMVMYDLKTAIRLYVLEGHKKCISACSFSPDGRRLVTLSLEESVVLVWKVGTSLVSFFNPGAPPRQGHSGSEPFKTLSFNVGDAGNMSLAETLQFVRFEWTADRSVKLKIRDSTLTFST
ncbi:hypothetical protein J3R30DRAFT_3715082 [Lentinula aciculospora]|uniref:WD40 repeat-like protein n=1 Tax=Lentinula aciculospora TaxID=153920 RepID=A0A9W9DFR2_9AGAR|nr:hypothetical protein J3R30DRAFT_3715082 [Lentinula aciculospora]